MPDQRRLGGEEILGPAPGGRQIGRGMDRFEECVPKQEIAREVRRDDLEPDQRLRRIEILGDISAQPPPDLGMVHAQPGIAPAREDPGAGRRHAPDHHPGGRGQLRGVRAEVFRAAGPYVDVVSINLYHVWTPDLGRSEMWERESGRPFLITDWYAKGMDSGLGNTTGAGWLVKTQRDRGRFYQNFALALLQSRGCVGWHWFKYIDNDPTAAKVDPSNVDSNKGIVSNRYVPYAPLLAAMKQLNQRAYSLAEYFNRQPRAAAGASASTVGTALDPKRN